MHSIGHSAQHYTQCTALHTVYTVYPTVLYKQCINKQNKYLNLISPRVLLLSCWHATIIESRFAKLNSDPYPQRYKYKCSLLSVN